MIIGTIQASSILLVAQLWFQIPFEGSYLTLFTGLGLFLLAAVGVGLLLSSVVTTMQQVRSIADGNRSTASDMSAAIVLLNDAIRSLDEEVRKFRVRA